jgi:hypothetical protein
LGAPALEIADDGRHEVVHRRIALEREQLRHADRSRGAHAREIVPHQVDDHQVFRAILRALGERLGQRGVVLRPETPRPGALDRPRLDVPAGVDAQKALRRGADDDRLRRIQVGGKRGRVARAETAVVVPRRVGEGRLEALRKIGLKDIARQDVLADPLHGVEIAAVRER